MPKVSVVIPVYNVEEYLRECIDSVIKQTLKDIEIILINDGSSDNSPQICDEYSKKDNRIKVIHQKNQGVSVARNNGINTAQGEYIYFVDSDDYLISNDFLEKAYNTAVTNDSDIVVVAFNTIQINKIKPKDIANFMTWNGFIKKEFLDKYPDIRFPEGMIICEDGLFSFKLILLTDKINRNDEIKYFYRKREGQVTQKQRNLKEIIFRILDETEKFCDKYDFWNTKSKKILSFLSPHILYHFAESNMKMKEKKELRKVVKDFLKRHNLTFTKFLQTKRSIYFIPFYYSPSYTLIDIAMTLYYLIVYNLLNNEHTKNSSQNRS